ncbi:hypothetical protein M2140_001919 [Clostridiales Family XIII bacterium PM5-7]
MKKFRMKIDEKVISYLERTFYENEMTKDNIAFLITNYGELVLETEAFKAYEKKQIEAKMHYENAKAEITERYVAPTFGNHNVNWQIDFRTRLLYVTQMCDCEIRTNGMFEEVM